MNDPKHIFTIDEYWCNKNDVSFYETTLTPVEVACRRINQLCNIRNLSFISLPALVLVLALAQVEVYQGYTDEETWRGQDLAEEFPHYVSNWNFKANFDECWILVIIWHSSLFTRNEPKGLNGQKVKQVWTPLAEMFCSDSRKQTSAKAGTQDVLSWLQSE